MESPRGVRFFGVGGLFHSEIGLIVVRSETRGLYRDFGLGNQRSTHLQPIPHPVYRYQPQ